MSRETLEKALFRLAMACMVLTWVGVAGALVIGFRDLMRGPEMAPPLPLFYAIAALVLLQFVAILAWRIVRRRK